MNRRWMIPLLTTLLITLLGWLVLAGGVLAQDNPPAGNQSTGDLMSRVDWWVIAGGGAPSMGAGVTLNDTLGQPVIGSSSGGDVGLAAGYWASCVAAAAGVPVVTVALDDVNPANVVLTWEPNTANARYQVWVSTDPYFDPDHPGGVTPIVTTATTYADAGAATNPVNHFYVVRGLNACGAPSADSTRKGEFTFGLTPGN